MTVLLEYLDCAFSICSCLLLYNSLIFNSILLSFRKDDLLCLIHFHSNFQLIPPSSLCDIGRNSWFLNFTKFIAQFYQYKLHISAVSYSIDFYPPKGTPLMLNLTTYRFSAHSSQQFTLLAGQQMDLCLRELLLITSRVFLSYRPQICYLYSPLVALCVCKISAWLKYAFPS